MSYSNSTFHLLALLTTLGVEGAGMALWARISHLRVAYTVGVCLLVNLLVHTLFWVTQPIFLTHWPLGLYLAESLVVLLEGMAYARWLAMGGWHPLLVSASLNALSLAAGLWLWTVLL